MIPITRQKSRLCRSLANVRYHPELKRGISSQTLQAQLHHSNISSLSFVRKFSSGKPETPSIADQIMGAKIADQEKKNEDNKDQKKGPKPMNKWQKYGYVFFGVSMAGLIIGNSIVFGMTFYIFISF